MKLHKSQLNNSDNNLIIVSKLEHLPNNILSEEELTYIKDCFTKKEQKVYSFNHFSHHVYVRIVKLKEETFVNNEMLRKEGNAAHSLIINDKLENITVSTYGLDKDAAIYICEGIALSNYQFLKYKKEAKKESYSLKEIYIADTITDKDITHLQINIDAVYNTRNWINEPLSYLTAEKLSEEIISLGKESGAKVEVFHKNKIEALKMGGLLAVNKGSIDPPTFTIMEWNPEHAINKKPYILVGKGVVYDTGGMNVKTGVFMNDMKMDMGGAAMMANTLGAIAKANLPLHVIALIPATDNRVNGNAYVSGDVITMHDGTTVEVINTDAEGRMILADALSYAKKYNPELVIDAATLTGAAARAIGAHGIVAMGNDTENISRLKHNGNKVYERIAEFPFWDEYAEEIKSDIADIKNLGTAEGGAIHAGKFLEHFTNYPYIHLDIAGVAFSENNKNYHGKGGTGIGIRLLFDFFKELC